MTTPNKITTPNTWKREKMSEYAIATWLGPTLHLPCFTLRPQLSISKIYHIKSTFKFYSYRYEQVQNNMWSTGKPKPRNLLLQSFNSFKKPSLDLHNEMDSFGETEAGSDILSNQIGPCLVIFF